MAKLADAGGLNPLGVHSPCGFESRPGHVESPRRVFQYVISSGSVGLLSHTTREDVDMAKKKSKSKDKSKKGKKGKKSKKGKKKG